MEVNISVETGLFIMSGSGRELLIRFEPHGARSVRYMGTVTIENLITNPFDTDSQRDIIEWVESPDEWEDLENKVWDLFMKFMESGNHAEERSIVERIFKDKGVDIYKYGHTPEGEVAGRKQVTESVHADLSRLIPILCAEFPRFMNCWYPETTTVFRDFILRWYRKPENKV